MSTILSPAAAAALIAGRPLPTEGTGTFALTIGRKLASQIVRAEIRERPLRRRGVE